MGQFFSKKRASCSAKSCFKDHFSGAVKKYTMSRELQETDLCFVPFKSTSGCIGRSKLLSELEKSQDNASKLRVRVPAVERVQASHTVLGLEKNEKCAVGEDGPLVAKKLC